MDRVKRIWYLSPMRAAKVLASLRIRAVSPEPSLLAHTSSESRGIFRQKARSLAPLNGWACAVEICHDGMLEDTNSLVTFTIYFIIFKYITVLIWAPSSEFVSLSIPSWHILTAHAQLFRGARDLAFCLKVPLDSLLVWASSEGSGETARMRRLAWTFAARIGDKYRNRLTRSIWYTYYLSAPLRANKMQSLFMIMQNRRARRWQKIFKDRNNRLYQLDDIIKYTCQVHVNCMLMPLW